MPTPVNPDEDALGSAAGAASPEASAEARYRALIENALDAIAILSADGLVHYQSPAIERILGYRPEEMEGKSAFDFIHPDEIALCRQHLERLCEQPGASIHVEYQAQTKTGSWRRMEAIVTNLLQHPEVQGIVLNARDVTERKEAAEALRESEARYRSIVETTSEGVWTLDAEGRTDYVNERMAEMLGYSVAEMRGRPLFDFLDEAAREEAQRNLERRRAGIAERVESRLRRKDGSELWITSATSPILGENGEFQGALALVTDLTQQRRTEEFLRTITENARCLLWRAEVEDQGPGPLRWVMRLSDEEAAQRFFPVDVLPGKSYTQSWYDSRLPEDQARTDRYGSQEVRAGRSYSQEFRCRRRDGEVRWLREDVQIQPLGPGRWRAIGVCTDVTLLKWAVEQAAVFHMLGEHLNRAASPEEAARIILGTADGLLGWDACWLDLLEPDGEHVRAVVLMDRLNGERVDVPQSHFTLRESPLARRTLEEGPQLILREAPLGPAPEFPFGDAARASASILCVPIRSAAHTIGALSIQSYTFQAYTEEDLRTLEALADYCAGALERVQSQAVHQRLEEQLRQAQKMEAVGRLAGGVAHDFNNMLAVINGYSDLLLQLAGPQSPLHNGLTQIQRAGERAADLTRQLLAYSRRQILETQTLDLNHVVARMEPLLRRLIGDEIELATRLEPGLGAVRADLGQIEQVITNLVVNARDAMPQGGKLTIETSNVELDADYVFQHAEVQPGLYVRIAVSDTGCGMTPEVLRQVFEPFFTTKPLGAGAGLGLSTVHGIVKQSGGHVWAYSEPGRGAAFKVYLPRTDVPAEAEKPDLDPAPAGSAETILLVEDEAMVRTLARHVLESHGYVVLEARDGAEALRLGAEHPDALDLVLTDVSMPGMSGRALAEQLRATRPDLRVLFMSGYTDDAIAHHGVLEAGVPFVQKPFTARSLAEKVREALDRPA